MINKMPKRVSNRILDIDLTGNLSPFTEDFQPVYLQMPGSAARYIATFTSKQTLDTFLKDYPIPYDRIIQIQHGGEFLESIPKTIEWDDETLDLIVVVDPYKHENGKCRFKQIFR